MKPCPVCGGDLPAGFNKQMGPAPSEVFRPSRLKPFGVFCAGAIFVVVGLLSILSEGARPEWQMYGVVAFFSLVALVGLVQILPGSTFLRLDDSGFTFRNLYKEHSYRWDEVTAFFVVSAGGRPMVAFNFAPGYQHSKAGRKLSQAIAECDGALPDTYGMGAAELAARLNQYRERLPPNAPSKA